jgi:hypothetical protein
MGPLRRAQRCLPFSISLLLATGCGPTATPIDNGTGGQGGSATGGVGGSGAGGKAGGGGSGGAVTGDGGTSTTGTAIPLPLSVTAQFQNQGWFADKAVSAAFQPGSMVIKQVDGTTGPCAMRASDARGKCLKVTYTPPANLVPPTTGSWVGVFFLTTLLNEHAEVVPPAKAGDANWGAEPGRNIAAGATRISFQAAAELDGTAVTFKAGTDKDSFVLPEQTEVLGTAWKTYELSLAGQLYGTNVIGAFAWILKDTTKPATFYLDNIVWQ